jgi:hypothetical protein
LDNISSPVDADNITISGIAEADSLVTVSDGQQIRTALLAPSISRFAIDFPLKQNSQNNFSVTATDAAGNISAPAFITVTEVSPSPVIRVVSPVTFQTKSKKYSNQNLATVSKITPSSENVTNPETLGTSSLNILKENNPTGSVKGESATSNESKPSQILMIILYLSAALFLVAWGLYLSKLYLRKKS